MEQNNMWMRYLTLGLITSLIMSLSSCKKIIDPEQSGEFYFLNETNYEISFYPAIIDSFSLLPMGKHTIRQNQPANNIIDQNSFMQPFGTSNTVTIKFGANKCLLMTPSSENSILNIKNYVAEKLGNRTYKFTYTFTEADYNRAVACP